MRVAVHRNAQLGRSSQAFRVPDPLNNPILPTPAPQCVQLLPGRTPPPRTSACPCLAAVSPCLPGRPKCPVQVQELQAKPPPLITPTSTPLPGSCHLKGICPRQSLSRTPPTLHENRAPAVPGRADTSQPPRSPNQLTAHTCLFSPSFFSPWAQPTTHRGVPRAGPFPRHLARRTGQRPSLVRRYA